MLIRSRRTPVVRMFALAVVLSDLVSFAQSDSLALGSAVASSGSAALPLVLTSPAGSEPAAIQWTLNYSPSSVASISATAGAAATAASKSISCAPVSGAYSCLLYGMNNTVIANGTVAVVNVTLAAGATSAAIGVTGAAGSSAAGDAILLTTTGGTVTSGGGTPVVSSISCLPSTLSANSSATCTVNLSGPAPAAGALVTLTNSNTTLSVPGSVQITGGAASGSFSVSTTTIPSLQSATITASYNGTSANTLISLVTVAMVSSLSCNPASVGANASTTCTVTLNKAAPAGGALVTLTNSNNTLTVPGSVTVPSSATSATFNATTTTVSSNQSATITASYNSTSVSATVGLITGTVQVSSVACDTNIGPNATDRCTVALNQPAPAAGATISLTSSNVAVTL